MSDPSPPPVSPTAAPPTSPAVLASTEAARPIGDGGPSAAAVPSGWPRSARLAIAVSALLAVIAIGLSWSTRQRQDMAEQAIVKRQQEAAEQAGEARALARQSEAVTRESAAKLALLEARVAETSLQRSQLEELIQSLARSRDENLLADVEASVRVAVQQSAITGSVEPLLAALRQAEERLARLQQPRLERVRRAVLQDLERLKGMAVVDVPTLSLRIDEAVRLVDQLPLLATIDRSGVHREMPPSSGGVVKAPSAAASSPTPGASPQIVLPDWRGWLAQAWDEVRALVRVTPVAAPEAALLAPEQAFFLRENLKLRLLNARLALLSRQFDLAQADLREALAWLERYFDKSSRRVAAVSDNLRQVTQQTRAVAVPRPEATLAALAAASGAR